MFYHFVTPFCRDGGQQLLQPTLIIPSGVRYLAQLHTPHTAVSNIHCGISAIRGWPSSPAVHRNIETQPAHPAPSPAG